MYKQNQLFSVILLLLFWSAVFAAEEMQHEGMDHSAMSHDSHQMKMQPVKEGKTSLTVLDTMPASGKSREAGFDGRYVMEPTSITDSEQEKCAKASRGIVMIDKAAWAKCGSLPAGLPNTLPKNTSTKPVMDHSQHMKHE